MANEEKASILAKMKERQSKGEDKPAKGNPVVRYLREVKEELKKVEWPTRQEVIRGTIIVLALSAFFAIFLGGSDYIFTYILEQSLDIF